MWNYFLLLSSLIYLTIIASCLGAESGYYFDDEEDVSKRSVTSAVTDIQLAHNVNELATSIGHLKMFPSNSFGTGAIEKRDQITLYGNQRLEEEMRKWRARKKYNKPHCYQQCRPSTFQECAFPRCQLKSGIVRRLCFLLCKQQEEHCVETCKS